MAPVQCPQFEVEVRQRQVAEFVTTPIGSKMFGDGGGVEMMTGNLGRPGISMRPGSKHECRVEAISVQK